MESVAWKNITVGVCWDLMCRISGMSFFARNFPAPWSDKFTFWPHPCFYAPSTRHWRSEFCPVASPKPARSGWRYLCWETSQYVRLQVLGTPCRQSAWNSSISLAGSKKHIHFSQQFPNRSDYTQRESNKGKGTEIKQSPALPFSQGKSLETRLKQWPPSLSLLWREKPVSTLVFKWKTCFHIWIQRFFS